MVTPPVGVLAMVLMLVEEPPLPFLMMLRMSGLEKSFLNWP